MRRFVLAGFLLAFSPSKLLLAQDITQLTDGITFRISHATMSGDGSKVFYLRHPFFMGNPTLRGTLYVRDVNCTVPEVLLYGVQADWMLADYSGTRLIFGIDWLSSSTDPDAFKTQVFSVDVITGKVVNLVNFRFQTPASTVQVAMAEEARKLILAPFMGGIWEIPWDGGELKKLVDWGQGIIGLAVDSRAETFYLADSSADNKGVWRIDRRTSGRLQLSSSAFGKLFVTPDGGTLFVSSQYTAFRYDRLSGKTETLFPNDYTRLGSVSRDGRWLLIDTTANLTGENPDRSPELFLVSSDGTARKQLTRADAWLPVFWDLNNCSVKLSDDGSSFMVLSARKLPGPAFYSSDQWLYRVVPTESRFQLVDLAANEQSRSWPQAVGHGSEFVFLSTIPGEQSLQFVRARSDGSHTRQVTHFQLGGIWVAKWSGNGDALAFVQGGSTLYLYRTKDLQALEIAKLKLRYSGLPNDYPTSAFGGVAVDDAGENVVFSTLDKLRPEDPDGKRDYLYLAHLSSGSVQIKLLGAGSSPAISGDGRIIVFQSVRDGKPEILVLRSDGSIAKVVEGASEPYITADGRWLVFLRGSIQIGVASIDGSYEHSFTPLEAGVNGFSSVEISQDGQTIAALGRGSGSSLSVFFAAYDRQGKEIKRVVLPEPTYIQQWSLDSTGEQAYFVASLKILNNLDANQEIFAARFKSFRSRIAEVAATEGSITGIALANLTTGPANLSMTARDRNGSLLNGIQNPVLGTVAPGTRLAKVLPEFLGTGIQGRTATLEVSSNRRLNSLVLVGAPSLEEMAGSKASDVVSSQWMFPVSLSMVDTTAPGTSSALILVNPNQDTASVEILWQGAIFVRSRNVTLPPLGTATVDIVQDLLRSGLDKALVEIFASSPIQAELRMKGKSANKPASLLFPGLESSLAASELILPHVVAGDAFTSRVWIANPADQPTDIVVDLLNSEGVLHAAAANNSLRRTVEAHGLLEFSVNEMLAGNSTAVTGYLRIQTTTSSGRIGGVALVGHESGQIGLLSVIAARPLSRKAVFPHVAQNAAFLTGYAVVNPYEFPLSYRLDVFDASGGAVASKTRWLPAHGKAAALLTEILTRNQAGGYFVITADWPVAVMAVIGTASGSAFANMPAQ